MNRRRRPGPVPPLPVPVRLPPRQQAGAEELEPGGRYDALRLADLDLTGADLHRTAFDGCEFDRVVLSAADLEGSHLVESELRRLDAAELGLVHSDWRDIVIEGSRLGAVTAYDATWRSLRITDTKIGYLNARGSTWRDITFESCSLDELDLAGATAERVALVETRVGVLRLTGARLTDVDLRGARLEQIEDLGGLAGAWVSPEQLHDLAPLLAAHLRIGVA